MSRRKAKCMTRRHLKIDDVTWFAYGLLVGEGNKSRDIRAYIDWRLANPDTALSKVKNERHVVQEDG